MITLTMITLTFAILSLKERCYTVTNFFFFGGGASRQKLAYPTFIHYTGITQRV